MKKSVFSFLTTLVVLAVIGLNVTLTFNKDQQSDISLLGIGQIAQAQSEGSGNISCYWTYKTGLFANWHIMTCYSCKPEEVKEFKDKGRCSF